MCVGMMRVLDEKKQMKVVEGWARHSIFGAYDCFR